jgi:hypothetical protein
VIYRLKNLKLIDDAEAKRLKAEEDVGTGKVIAEFLQATEPHHAHKPSEDFRRRFLGLALEAYRREEITRSKFTELAAMVDIDRASALGTLASAGLG